MENKKRASDYDCELPEKEWVERESEKCSLKEGDASKEACEEAIASEKDKRAQTCSDYVDQINRSGS